MKHAKTPKRDLGIPKSDGDPQGSPGIPKSKKIFFHFSTKKVMKHAKTPKRDLGIPKSDGDPPVKIFFFSIFN